MYCISYEVIVIVISIVSAQLQSSLFELAKILKYSNSPTNYTDMHYYIYLSIDKTILSLDKYEYRT